jgi:propionyl-CoA carboxylase alpha chain
MFKKILIANRGEIACRVMKTAKKMGIKTVAVYSEADKLGLHVQMADEAVCVGPAPSVDSYLSVKNILAAIKQTGADAVHPGYGFLSENAAFARKLAREGIAFIGPKPLAIKSMGDKIESKKLAEKAGVNVIPGHTEAVSDARKAVTISNKIGYPVMLKASAGGGGKGMRIARSDDEVADGLRSAVREAESSFGDGRVFIEKYIEQPRHIEIQVLADSQGNTVYLGERECSIQRRHQKVIEEAPSPFVTPDIRAAMGQQAIKLAKAVKYVSAGTVEFIMDVNQNFYFLEMNTRLQVEHPVTEYITGLDLVEQMIRIAAGEKLEFGQDDVALKGWAMECRIYAEDPVRGFLPSAGRLVRYVPPVENESVRVDTGVYEGGEIPIYYDPMIAKLVTSGSDRKGAIENMQSALDQFYIKGISHNIGFLAAVMAHPRFHAGDLSTQFIDDEYKDGFDPTNVKHHDPDLLVAVIASIHRTYMERAALISGRHDSARKAEVEKDWIVHLNSEKTGAQVSPLAGGFGVTVGKKRYEIRTGWTFGQPVFKAHVNGIELHMQIERKNMRYRIVHSGFEAQALVLTPRVAELYSLMPEKVAADLSKFILSPMPGLLVSVAFEAGQEVKAGEEVCVVEAMKMENVLRAERDGVISAIHAKSGDNLAVDQTIIEFE